MKIKACPSAFTLFGCIRLSSLVLFTLLSIANQAAESPNSPHQSQESENQDSPLRIQPDHAALIMGLNSENLEAGRVIYNSICITCHGDQEKEGTLPTSRKFWEAEFKNGNDPYSLYLTLGNGFGQMPQFPFLSPQQRYDVIHYVREELVRPNNPQQYFAVSDDYLKDLPKGKAAEEELSDAMQEYARGPQYLRMNFGPVLNWTFEVEKGNIAYKGIAVRLDEGPGGISKGRAWMLYDHDTMRVAAGWTGEQFLDWRGIAFDGSHGTHTRIVGEKLFINPPGPGWAEPGTENWSDPRFRGRDGKPYGPLPRDWVQFKGHYLYGNRVVLQYTVGDVDILESPGLEQIQGHEIFTRTLNIGPSKQSLTLKIAPEHNGVSLRADKEQGWEWITDQGFHLLHIPAESTPLHMKVLILKEDLNHNLPALTELSAPPENLTPYTLGGPARWDQSVVTKGTLSDSKEAYVVDTIEVPHNDLNPWESWMRMGGFDFLPNGKSAYLCTWMGDVWRVDGIDADLNHLTWTRVASGLFQPLGLLVRGKKVFVSCRDQIVELQDLNQDGEFDYYRCFNNDHQVTEHFHEFAMGLQQDQEGNFYYAKSARHALPALVEHHGTLLKVSADGSSTEILATGFRAANGVCINPDGSFFVTDQEGHWTPKNRINRVQPGGFYGNMMGYHDQTSSADTDMEQPMVWITNAMDRSPGELLWAPVGDQWGPLGGSLLNLSYGTGKVFIVPHEEVDGQFQGGVVELPIPIFLTGVMRGRFHPEDGQLYACGMFAWAGNQQVDGGFYRVRYTGRSVALPIRMHALSNGIEIGFTHPVDVDSAMLTANYKVKTWTIERTQNYGSRHLNEIELKILGARVSSDRRTVFLSIENLKPTRCMEIVVDIQSAAGESVHHTIHNTIHQLSETDNIRGKE